MALNLYPFNPSRKINDTDWNAVINASNNTNPPVMFTISSGSGLYTATNQYSKTVPFTNTDFATLLTNTVSNASNTAPGGGKIFIERGVYPIFNTPINITGDNNIWICGEGQSPATTLQLQAGASRNILTGSGLKSITISDMLIDGGYYLGQSAVNNTALFSFNNTDSERITLRNLTFLNSPNAAVTIAASHAKIEDCYFLNCNISNGTGFNGQIGTLIVSGNSSQRDIKILHNYFSTCKIDVTDADLTCTHLLIDGNTFYNPSGSSCVNLGACNYNTITNNFFIGNPPIVGIDYILLGTAHTTISNNYFTNVSNRVDAFIRDQAPIFDIIQGNTFYGFTSNAHIAAGESNPSDGKLFISNNTFRDVASTLEIVRIQGISHFVINNNDFYSPFGTIAMAFDTNASGTGSIVNNIFVGDKRMVATVAPAKLFSGSNIGMDIV